MHPLEYRFLNSIRKSSLIAHGDTVIVAVSGGPDSVALLHLLTKTMQDCHFVGTYINHNLRPDEVQTERELVGRVCQAAGIPFEYISIDVVLKAKRDGHSLEDCARQLRYRELEKIRSKYNAHLIAVGHTLDDQAEQFLIRLIRGSGLKGLGGMAPKRGRVIRPLLGFRKSDLISYLAETGAAYCIDSSNTSRDFLRNKIRLDLLPQLERNFNPVIKQTIVNTMSVLQDEEHYLDNEATRCYRSLVSHLTIKNGPVVVEERHAALDALMSYHPALRRRIIEKICWDCNCRPTYKMINRIDEFGTAGRNGTRLHLPGNLRVIKTDASLIFTLFPAAGSRQSDQEAHPPHHHDISIAAEGVYEGIYQGTTIILQEIKSGDRLDDNGLILDADLIEYPLVLRRPRSGEYFRPLGAPGRKKVSRFLSDKKIPQHLRYRFPVLASKDTIIALPGLMIHDKFKTGPETTRFLQIIFTDEQSPYQP